MKGPVAEAIFAIRGTPETPFSSTERLVLLALANHANLAGQCWPGQKLLAEETGFTPRTVLSALGSLSIKGFIVREPRRRRDGYRTEDLVTIIYESLGDTLSGELFSHENPPRSQVKLATISGERVSRPTSLEPSKEPIVEPIACAARAMPSASPRTPAEPLEPITILRMTPDQIAASVAQRASMAREGLALAEAMARSATMPRRRENKSRA